ncbi:hypothetical protein J8I29_14395 [Labrys sp. LIt4]|nr:hypothetical protein [Labrys sp. LIt4]
MEFDMKRVLIVLGALSLLAGCKTDEQQRAIDMRNDNRLCQAQGFAPGSQALAECMNTAAQSRAADKARQAAAQQAQAARDQANWDAWRQKAANNGNSNSSWNNNSSWSQSNNQTIDTRPQFDRQGNPNFDTQGNYQGCHGIGCQVDNPDAPN